MDTPMFWTVFKANLLLGVCSVGLSILMALAFAARAALRRLGWVGATAPPVKYGHPPGKRPSVQAIGRWAKAHGISTNPWVLARNIAREGTKGVLFLEKAEEAGRKKAQEMMGKLAVEIEKRFGS